MLWYKLSIDKGNAKPVVWKKPQYGQYKYKILIDQSQALLINARIEKYGGPWGISIFLASKLHHEHTQNIDDLIWRMCVSYGKLNAITKPFNLPIINCDDAIRTVGAWSNTIRIISMDERQGFHKIPVHRVDREKLSFFVSDNQKIRS